MATIISCEAVQLVGSRAEAVAGVNNRNRAGDVPCRRVGSRFEQGVILPIRRGRDCDS